MTAPSAFLEDLRQVGVDVTDPWDLVNTRSSYRPAIPVLLRWLALADSDVPAHERDRFREAVVRSLGVKEARGHAAPALVEEFRRPGSSPDVRWAAGNALSVVADDGVFDDLVLLARDRSYGRAWEMLPLALARTKHPEAVQVLLELLDDDDIARPRGNGARQARPERGAVCDRTARRTPEAVGPQGSEEGAAAAGGLTGAGQAKFQAFPAWARMSP